jgi:hypothetical protein
MRELNCCRYYEDKEAENWSRSRWVEFASKNPDATQIPPEWYCDTFFISFLIFFSFHYTLKFLLARVDEIEM